MGWSGEVALVIGFASVMRCAECTRISMRSPFARDCCCDVSLIRHPQVMSIPVLSIFSVFTVGSGCLQQSQMAKRGNEERRGGLGRLNVGGSNRGGNDGDGILRSAF